MSYAPSGTSWSYGVHRALCYVSPMAMALVDYVLHHARCPIAPCGAMEHIMLLVGLPDPIHGSGDRHLMDLTSHPEIS